MSDRDVPVTHLGVTDRPGRLQVEHVVGAGVIRQPEVPDPPVWEMECHEHFLSTCLREQR